MLVLCAQRNEPRFSCGHQPPITQINASTAAETHIGVASAAEPSGCPVGPLPFLDDASNADGRGRPEIGHGGRILIRTEVGPLLLPGFHLEQAEFSPELPLLAAQVTEDR
jgi:hypothetical protein